MTAPDPLPLDPYRHEKTASALSTAQLIRSGQLEMASFILDRSDVETQLDGLTNAIFLAVDMLSGFSGLSETEVFEMLRAASWQVVNAPEHG